jgi:uncharacterized membrane protein YgcG
MPIASPIGFLDVVNATLRASQVETTSRLTVANTAATKNFSVGDRFHVDKDSVDPVSVTGNVVASGIKISNLTISPIFDLGAVSNVGNTTSNTLQFANATTSFVASSNVEIGGNITLTSNAQVKVGSNVLAEYTGPHVREPKEMPLKKFPEILFEDGKFDRNDSTNTYTQAGYTVTASDDRDDRKAWEVFDGISDGVTLNAWQTNSIFNTSTGLPTSSTETYTDTLPGGTNHVGVTLKLQLPKAIQISRIFMSAYDSTGSDDRSPKEGVFLGSTNGTSWELIKSFTESDLNYVSYNGDELGKVEATITGITNTSYYSYIVLIVKKIQVPNLYGVLNIKEIKYYGTEEPAPPGDLSLDTTLKSTFNSVRSNNYVMYFDGEDPAAGNVPKYLPSGSAKSITPNNVVFDATNNCWTLNGSTESNVTTGSLGFEGDAPHTVSTWINASNLEANATTQQLFSIGSGYSEEIVRVDDTQIAANTWHNVTYAYQGEGGSKVTYVDGRKVEEAQVEDTFGEYPPFAMTGYSQGGYVVSFSDRNGNTNWVPWYAFNGDITSTYTGHITNNNYTTADPGPYNGTDANALLGTRADTGANIVDGSWLKIEMPHKLVADYLQIYARTDEPDSFKLYGSNDDLVWTELLSVTGNTTLNAYLNYPTTIKGAFKYFAMTILKNGSAQPYTRVDIMRIYGHKEGDLTRFPEPTRVLKYPHISIPSSYAKRGYVVSASNDQYKYGANNLEARGAWAAFGNTGSEPGWQLYYNGPSNAPYASSADGSGFYQNNALASTLTGTSHRGEWIKLELPHKLMVQKMKTDHGTQPERLGQVILLGSNNDSDWYTIKDTFALTNASAQTTDINATVAYKYIVLIVKSLQNANLNVDLKNLEYYGTEEDTGTPAIVGGPFAGKVANFRVYDQYLGDERIQEIYDAQKDEFGHKKSSMTFYKGRVGVGTTEPEGALTVVDEPNAVAKFPSSNLSADYSFIEGEGCIKISTAGSSGSSGSSGGGGGGYGGGSSGGYGSSGSSGGSGFNAFDGLTSTCWSSTPTRHTRVSEEVDFGAWLKIQTPESVSLKKAEIESKPDWMQVGSEILGPDSGGQFGRAVACNHDGTRVIVGGYPFNSQQGKVIVYDWNGTTWTQVGNVLTGVASNAPHFGHTVAISGDGNIIAVAAPYEHAGSGLDDAGTVRVYYLVGAIWTILPDSGSLTTTIGSGKVFVGATANDYLGYGGVKLSYDGYTILMAEHEDDTGFSNAGRVRVYTYANGAWSQKGSTLTGTAANERIGFSLDMSEDGNHIIFTTDDGGASGTNPYVKVYEYGSDWTQKGSTFTYTANDGRHAVAISNDGNVVAIGQNNADVADGARAEDGGVVKVYNYEGSAWVIKGTINDPVEATDEEFGSFIALSGDGKRLIVSKPDEGSTNQGQLFTFEYTGSSWITRQPVASYGALGDSADGDARIGRGGNDSRSLAISRDGSAIIAGEQGFDPPSGSNGGRVRVFNMPSNIKSIWGSNDDVNWTKITTAPTREEATSNVAGLAFGYDDRLEFKNLDNPNYYKYHAIVADAFTRLKDIKLFGIRNQGSSTLHDGTLTLTKKVTAPQLESTGILNMKGDYTEIRANSNVVTCFDRSKKLIKYPRVAMTDNSSGGYVASASSTYTNFNPYEAFDNEDPGSTAYWSGSTQIYNTNGTWGGGTAAAYTTNVEGVSKYGEWIQIQLPNKIKYNYSKIKAPSPAARQPRDGYILGSNDTSGAWTILHRFEDVSRSSTADLVTYTPPSEYTQFFQYFRLVIETINDGGLQYVGVNTWDIFGCPEYDPEAHGTDVTVKSVANVPNTDWLEVYYDGQDYTEMPATVDNKTGVSTYDATSVNSVGFDATQKAFTFDAASSQYLSSSTPVDGNYIHSISIWFKGTNLTPTAGDTLMWIGDNVNNERIEIYLESDKISYSFKDNDVVATPTLSNNRWYHLTVTYNGVAGVTGREIYLDGVKQSATHTGNSAVLAVDNNTLNLGGFSGTSSTYMFSGSIANFRLFNRALTSDEIYQLYAYQKEYFGHRYQQHDPQGWAFGDWDFGASGGFGCEGGCIFQWSNIIRYACYFWCS